MFFNPLIVPEVFIGDKIILFPLISLINVNAEIISSFVSFEHLIIPISLFKSSLYSHNPVLFAPFIPKYLHTERQINRSISCLSKNVSVSFIILNKTYLCFSILTNSIQLS